MQTNQSQTNRAVSSVCRNCCFYQPQGHNGGNCHQLNVAVSGNWPTCQLALPAFAPTWQVLDDLPVQTQTETSPVIVEAPLMLEALEIRATINSYSNVN
jgi:hypothetical protein